MLILLLTLKSPHPGVAGNFVHWTRSQGAQIFGETSLGVSVRVFLSAWQENTHMPITR